MRILLVGLFILAAWKWSKWRNWREYYPTILFMVTLSLLEMIITENHRLWLLIKTPSPTSALLNNLFITATAFPALVLLYLSNYPQRPLQQVWYIPMWVMISSSIEFIMGYLGTFTYSNGWSLPWSILFNCTMYPILRVHHSSPLLAWLLSGIVFIFMWKFFGFSLEMII